MHQSHAPAATPLAYSQLEQQIERKQALLGVIGLGYVGLPLIRAFASAGFRVLASMSTRPKSIRSIAARAISSTSNLA